MPFYPETSLDADGLLTTLKPALAQGDLTDALETVRKNWTPRQLIELLSSGNVDVRKVAALSLGFVGARESVQPLAVALHDKDELVNQVAEHALWCIWFRLGDPRGVALRPVWQQRNKPFQLSRRTRKILRRDCRRSEFRRGL